MHSVVEGMILWELEKWLGEITEGKKSTEGY